jgi:hypothetical protein
VISHVLKSQNDGMSEWRETAPQKICKNQRSCSDINITMTLGVHYLTPFSSNLLHKALFWRGELSVNISFKLLLKSAKNW